MPIKIVETYEMFQTRDCCYRSGLFLRNGSGRAVIRTVGK